MEHARERALALLARRPHSRAELREALLRAGYAAAEIETELERLCDAHWLDDRRLAEQVLRAHARRGHAPRRACDELARRGVAAETIRAAAEELEAEGGSGPVSHLATRLAALLAAERRPLDERGLRRVYNRLLRAGFEDDEVRAALEPHWPSAGAAQPDDAQVGRRGRTTEHDDDGT